MKSNNPAKQQKIKTEWDLHIYYPNSSDKSLEEDISVVETAITKFAKKYRNKDFTQNSAQLSKALADYFHLDDLRPSKVLRYLFFRKTLNSNDSEASKLMVKYEQRLVHASNQILFFHLRIAQISKKEQVTLLKDEKIAPYTYWLKKVFANGKHMLSEEVEQVLNLKSRTSKEAWINATEKILSNRTITYKKQTLPLLNAIELTATVPNKERNKIWQEITVELEKCSEFAEHELNALVLNKHTNDNLRGYQKPYEATILSYENDIESVEKLVSVISKKGFQISRQYYKLLAKTLKVNKISYADRHHKLFTPKKYEFSECVDICRDVFYGVKQEYGELFDFMLHNGRFDVYPKASKQGGAFMSSGYNEPIFIMLNHANSFSSLTTIAHEMGHAIHTYQTQNSQPSWNQSYSTVTAETASTFFESLVIQAALDKATGNNKIALLQEKIVNDIATMQRQIAFFNFENTLHTHIRNHGGATNTEMAAMFQKCMSEYLGPAVDMTISDSYSYVFISHFRRMFYVYSYAYGHLMSAVMLQKYLEDKNYISEVQQFLQSGKSASVEDIFKSIHIDPYNEDTFAFGLNALQKDIKTLNKLIQ